MDSNPETIKSEQNNEEEKNENPEKTENNIEEEKKEEIKTNELESMNQKEDSNIKTDNTNIYNRYEDFEKRYQEIKLKVIHGNVKDKKEDYKLQDKKRTMNDKNRKKQFQEINSKLDGKESNEILDSNQLKEFDIINDFYYKLENFYADAEKKEKKEDFELYNSTYKNISLKTPRRTKNNESSDFYSFSSDKNNPTNLKISSNKNNYINIFKPNTINAISSIKSAGINKKPKAYIQKRDIQFNKKYYNNELQNLNSLLFGSYGTSFKKKKDKETIDPFFILKNNNNNTRSFRFMEQGNNNFLKFSKKTTSYKPSINMVI